ncbi:hypothetical protein AKJ09_02166 [Labilithrix luteola]|uniref:Lipoprotein n=1 Tax=Labilithrix luteola TaxID=1391654 RepID=A0A0K1PPQ7_9BACT|nr:hypothetical protein [Labilithrix luteola]AKU95502.1 hypothetical protein AKJ09_02166 [Labilithrix luteola]
MKSGYVVGFVVAALLGCGKPIASIPFSSVGTTEQTAVALPAGATVSLAVHAAKHSYQGSNNVMLDAELLDRGTVVGRMTCEGFELEGMAGSGCSTTHYNSSCSMTAPASGADAIRVSTRLERPGSATFEGLEVRIMK